MSHASDFLPMTSFRPRPIDIDKPMPVVHKDIEDDLTSRPLVASVATGMESHEENESHIRKAIEEAARKKTKIQANIPTPTCRIVAYYEEMHPDDFYPGEEFILYQQEVNIFEEPDVGIVEYDLDLEDVAFIRKLNKESGALKARVATGEAGASAKAGSGVSAANGLHAKVEDIGDGIHGKRREESGEAIPPGFIIGSDGVLVKKKRPVGRPRKHPVAGSEPRILRESEFEFVMDRLEREQAKNLVLPPPAAHLGAEGFVTLQYFSRQMADARRCSLSAETISAIYFHWVEKRNQIGGALLDRYKPRPKSEDPSPWVAFRPRDKDPKYKKPRRSNVQVMSRIRHLKREMATAQMLLELVVKREKDKKDLLRVSKRHFERDFVHSERQLKDGSYSSLSRDVFEEEDYVDDDEPLSYREPPESKRSRSAPAVEEELQVGDLTLESEREFDRFPAHVHHTFKDPREQKHWGTVSLPGMKPFRGRARMGRGGRVIFDRYYDPSVAPKYFSSSESDSEDCSSDSDIEILEEYSENFPNSFLAALAGLTVSRGAVAVLSSGGQGVAEQEDEDVLMEDDVVMEEIAEERSPSRSLFYHSSRDGEHTGEPLLSAVDGFS